MSTVRVEKPRPHTSVIVMDRPERMNSMAFDLVTPLLEAFREVAADIRKLSCQRFLDFGPMEYTHMSEYYLG